MADSLLPEELAFSGFESEDEEYGLEVEEEARDSHDRVVEEVLVADNFRGDEVEDHEVFVVLGVE